MNTGLTLAAAAQRTLGLIDRLATDIPADRFARLAPGANGPIHANHPAWVYGHLALYPTQVIGSLGGDGAAVAPPPAWTALFDHGTDCVDDPDATLYPAKDELTDLCRRAYAHMHDTIRDAPEDRLQGDSPERFRKAFPTLAVMAGFLITSHPMFHLGQVSTWRRVEGMGSAM